MKKIGPVCLSLIIVIPSFLNCSQTDVPVQKVSEGNLRNRIKSAHDYFRNGRFSAFIATRSKRERSSMFESDEEKNEMLIKWQRFIEREKPTFQLKSLAIDGKRATAEMRNSIIKEDGTRNFSILYDLWIFEDGDWFLDDALKSAPEFLRKD